MSLEAVFASPAVLAQGVLAGLVFGFLLQRAHVTRYSVILGQFLLRDFTVLKVMGTAIVVGAIGIFGMPAMGMEIGSHVKGANLLLNAGGGVVFGVGMAVLGYCPGTAVAAVGDGSRHAWFGIAGMLTGAAIYAEAYPWVNRVLAPIGDLGKVTIPGELHISPWLMIAVLVVVAAGGFYLLERGAAGSRKTPAAV